MEIVEENCAMLSNYEVYHLLEETHNKPKNLIIKTANLNQNSSTISYETLRHLKSTPVIYQNKNNIQSFLEAVLPFNLTKAEKLMIINLRPKTPVEIQLIIEESEERLAEDQIDELLQIIQNILPNE
ncbi:unnamed protein product [Gordionus sp. m RMFG-2023]